MEYYITTCACGHKKYDHYSQKYDEECVHKMGRYTGIKCDCRGFSVDNLDYIEKIAKDRNLI
jgi:hypothetical protein